MLKQARWCFQISAGHRNWITLEMGLSILACKRLSKTFKHLLVVPYLDSLPCHGYAWLPQVKTCKMAETLHTGLHGEDPDGQVPHSLELGRETDIWVRNSYYPWLPSHIFCHEDSSCLVYFFHGLHLNKTKQQNKYSLLSCFPKHKKASKGQF